MAACLRIWSIKLLLLYLTQIVTAYHHRCIHDKIKPTKLLRSGVRYNSNFGSSMNNLQRRNLGIASDEFEPIRIRPYWESLEASKEISIDQINMIKHMISAVITYFESFINVIRANGPLYYPRDCDYGYSVSSHGPTNYYYNCYKYSSKTKCGAMNIPSQHFRQDWLYDTDGNVNTQEFPSGNGLIDVDLILYITSSTLLCDEEDVLAWARPCAQDQNGRPIFGTINFCPSESIGVEWKHDITTMIHEVTHVLGFSSLLYSSFIDKYSTQIGFDNVIKSNVASMNGNMMNKWIITPNVKHTAQSYFNCSNIIGGPLEDDNNHNGIPSHWEEHFLNGEYMLEYIDTKLSFVSKLTLALLQDTGWYHIDENYAEPQFQFGYNYGCEFFEEECFNSTYSINATSSFNEYFCNPNLMKGEYCTSDSLSIGYCSISLETPSESQYKYFGDNAYYGYETSEYCPFIRMLDSNIPHFHYECFNVNGNKLDNFSSNYVPWNYSLSSRCINVETSYIQEKENRTIKLEDTAFCFPIICNGYNARLKQWNSIYIIVGDSNVTCYQNDTLSTRKLIKNGMLLYWIQCPNINTICINQQPFKCEYGYWNDKYNKCICQAGYYGDLCNLKLNNTMIDSVNIYNSTWNQISIENDLCAIIIDDNYSDDRNNIIYLLNGTWIYKGYNISNIYPYYVNNGYYLYFDTWYHTWNIGTKLNHDYMEITVNALCDIGERPYDVTDCSHLFYFRDNHNHQNWTQNLYFMLLNGNCDNQSNICQECHNFNASQWKINSLYIPTSSPTITTSLMTTELNETNETRVNSDTIKNNEDLLVSIIIVVIIVLILVIILGIYCNHKCKNDKLNKQLKYVKQDLVEENENENQVSNMTQVETVS